MSDAMEPGAMGVAHLLSQSSGMGLLPLVLLVLMSAFLDAIVSWVCPSSSPVLSAP